MLKSLIKDKGMPDDTSAAAFGRRMAKQAEEGSESRGGPYPGYHGIAAQQYAPVMGRREFGLDEKKEIEAGKSRWFPKLFKSYATPASQLMASPGRQALMAGIPAGVVGAMLGAGVGGSMQGGGQGLLSDAARPAAGAAIGGLGIGGLAALLTYLTRNQRNEDVEEIMRRLPPHPTRRDILSDSVYQKDQDRRDSRINNAALAGALASR
jgi:hypothetical protein